MTGAAGALLKSLDLATVNPTRNLSTHRTSWASFLAASVLSSDENLWLNFCPSEPNRADLT